MEKSNSRSSGQDARCRKGQIYISVTEYCLGIADVGVTLVDVEAVTDLTLTLKVGAAFELEVAFV